MPFVVQVKLYLSKGELSGCSSLLFKFSLHKLQALLPTIIYMFLGLTSRILSKALFWLEMISTLLFQIKRF